MSTNRSKRGKHFQYARESLIDAVTAVKDRSISISEASRKYGVPRKTISNHVKGGLDLKRPGRDFALTGDEEGAILGFLHRMARNNFPLRRSDVKSLIVDMLKRKADEVGHIKFNREKGPSDAWFRYFQKRHPEIKWSVPHSIDQRRASASDEYTIYKFFNLLEGVLKENGIFNKPSQIWNCDESGVSYVATREKAYGIKGEAHYQQKVLNIDHITVMMCANASGCLMPTFLIYEKNLPTLSVKDHLPSQWLLGVSPNGYMDKHLFKRWFKEIFLEQCGNERPVLLLLDNYDSYFSFEVLDLAHKNQVIIVGLPAHTTHILQPLDPIKDYQVLLPSNLGKSEGSSEEVVSSSFRRSGICPFDPTAVDSSKIRKRIIFKPNEKLEQAVSIVPVDANIHTTAALALGGPSTSGSTSMETDVVIETDVPPIMALDEVPSDKCGVMRGPVISEAKSLPYAMQAAFRLPDESTPKQNDEKPTQRRRLVPFGRVLTSEEGMKQVKEKEEKIEKELKEKEERRKKHQEKQSTIKPQPPSKRSKRLITKKKMSSSSESDSPVEENSHKDSSIDESVCGKCKSEFPPTKKGKGRGKGKKLPITWIGCDDCRRWYHCTCVNIDSLPDNYQCDFCL